MNYRYSYNKTSLGSANNSRHGSRGASAAQPGTEPKDPSALNQQQPLQCAPTSLQLGPNGQYRSATSMHSGSHKSLKAAGGCTTSSQNQSNVPGVNHRYATRGQRARYDNESYQDDEDDEELATNEYHLARTGNVSRESLRLFQNANHPEAAASRSFEVEPHSHAGGSLHDTGAPRFNKNQTQAIKIENCMESDIPSGPDALPEIHIVDNNQRQLTSSQSSDQINRACILASPSDGKYEDQDIRRLKSPNSELGTSSGRKSKDVDQLSKMRS